MGACASWCREGPAGRQGRPGAASPWPRSPLQGDTVMRAQRHQHEVQGRMCCTSQVQVAVRAASLADATAQEQHQSAPVRDCRHPRSPCHAQTDCSRPFEAFDVAQDALVAVELAGHTDVHLEAGPSAPTLRQGAYPIDVVPSFVEECLHQPLCALGRVAEDRLCGPAPQITAARRGAQQGGVMAPANPTAAQATAMPGGGARLPSSGL